MFWHRHPAEVVEVSFGETAAESLPALGDPVSRPGLRLPLMSERIPVSASSWLGYVTAVLFVWSFVMDWRLAAVLGTGSLKVGPEV